MNVNRFSTENFHFNFISLRDWLSTNLKTPLKLFRSMCLYVFNAKLLLIYHMQIWANNSSKHERSKKKIACVFKKERKWKMEWRSSELWWELFDFLYSIFAVNAIGYDFLLFSFGFLLFFRLINQVKTIFKLDWQKKNM